MNQTKYPEKGEWLSDICYECLKNTDMPECPLPEEEYQKCKKRLKVESC